MEVAVFDTYFKKKDGRYLHFNIIVHKDTAFEEVLKYGNSYLETKGFSSPVILHKDCRFCHITPLIPLWEAQISSKGYFIHELEGCRS
ncbi:protein of unknown function [Chitinophaga terrae (ex Kim and Jung 2007)]|jgi:hypothetical protein|uniref:DUF2024 family protein n=1 Tax=Chitinophaga terrae (ex Kim and Jung 2007) TaxID=408074 RepID=A0A1H4DV53_9BACT|nr:DUF2024 family protein [Chitinophaga terrae (ex Kim and Jung 2007)]MDQ0105017.1 hypothetical protein [Chitinophaga terrae (ex Kim and Jung 2007)]GEP91344.1 hypothetical protein CTE07_29890 [Chitinophaga terrae (ex Kim and Jung 2007)]SEA76476.1 protein of unknown function [Chitinophaga terrae (ex Kim and Jung 2007)]